MFGGDTGTVPPLPQSRFVRERRRGDFTTEQCFNSVTNITKTIHHPSNAHISEVLLTPSTTDLTKKTIPQSYLLKYLI